MMVGLVSVPVFYMVPVFAVGWGRREHLLRVRSGCSLV